MSPLISIIIPTYNRAHLISETLDSILSQSYKNWECIVVDDGSTDNTADVLTTYIKKDNRIQYHERPKERIKGPNSCRNYGFELSKGEYIKWFDSDDCMDVNLLENQMKVINEKVECVVCKVAYYDFENNKILKENKIYSDNLIEDYLIGNITFYISGPLWKKSFLDKQTELFDESITNLDDWDFNLRMLYNRPSIVYINESLIRYRIHNASLSHEISKLNFQEIQSEFNAREKHLRLIKINKSINSNVLENYIKKRYKYFLREALVQNNNKIYFFKKLLFYQFITKDFLSMWNSIIGFLLYAIFNKGYKYL